MIAIFYPKKIIFFLRNLYDLLENIANYLSYFILSIANYFHYLLGRVIVPFNVFQGNWHNIKKYKKNKIVSIFGNGPSLINISLEDIKGTDIMTCNFFNRHPNAQSLSSTFHLIADGHEEFGSIDECLSHVSDAYLVHYSSKEFLNKPEKDIFYFVPSILTIARWKRRNLFNTYPLPAPLNSVQLALILAILLEYKKIYLYGVDENQLANPSIQENSHFYEEDEASAQGMSGVIDSTYIDRIKGKYLTMIGYQNLKGIADAKGIEIINKNKNSFVDIFKFE